MRFSLYLLFPDIFCKPYEQQEGGSSIHLHDRWLQLGWASIGMNHFPKRCPINSCPKAGLLELQGHSPWWHISTWDLVLVILSLFGHLQVYPHAQPGAAGGINDQCCSKGKSPAAARAPPFTAPVLLTWCTLDTVKLLCGPVLTGHVVKRQNAWLVVFNPPNDDALGSIIPAKGLTNTHVTCHIVETANQSMFNQLVTSPCKSRSR